MTTTPTQTTPSAGAGSTTVRHLSEDELNDRIRTLVARLFASLGTTDLSDVLDAHYDFDLSAADLSAFTELTSSAYLAGLPSLPCCSDDDPELLEKWMAGITEIYATGDGSPAGEPMLVQSARRADPSDHIRVPSTGTTIGGFLGELDRYVAHVKAQAAAEAAEAAYKHAAQHFRDMAGEKVERRTAITMLDNLAAGAAAKLTTTTSAHPSTKTNP